MIGSSECILILPSQEQFFSWGIFMPNSCTISSLSSSSSKPYPYPTFFGTCTSTCQSVYCKILEEENNLNHSLSFTLNYYPSVLRKPLHPPYLSWYDDNAYYDYHDETQGHPTENCMLLKRKVQALINSG
ncbi:reverse transcriptase [Gossypium australe]|uniref:Reverse transcriptase n=1 Tax=Gossypium australe TaxID=47621 RepID=A0A5B6W029_9ROSI|nr:reverse transcriptase [Gossypium australe]